MATRKSTPTATTPQSSATLRQVPPGELLTATNVRDDLGLDQGFLASITAQGVLVPIVATANPAGGLVIAHGHRRAAAAAQVGLATVPVMVWSQEQAEAARVMAQLSENSARTPLNAHEQTRAHDQLALLEVPVAEVARVTGTKPERVRALRTLAAHPAAVEAMDSLDIEGALLVAEFEHDTEFVKSLIATGLRGGRDEMARLAQRYREELVLAAAIAEREATWAAQGYQVVRGSTIYDDRYLQLWSLRNPDGERITADSHSDCPGRAIRVWGWRADRLNEEHLCADPKAGGHKLEATAPMSKSQEAKAAERIVVVARNKDWRAAESVRRAHVRDWLAGAKPTPGITRWLLAALLGGFENSVKLRDGLPELGWAPDVLKVTPHRSDPSPYASGHSGGTVEVAPNPSSARATMGALALVLADRELGTGVQSWRSPHPGTAMYLAFLEEHTGYVLGAVEKLAAGRQPEDQ